MRRWRCSTVPTTPSRLLLDHIEERMREAAAERRYERAEVLRRRRERLAEVLGRLERRAARHARAARGWCSPAIRPSRGFDAFWIVGGRVRDWGPLRRWTSWRSARRRCSRARRPGAGAVPVEEVDEVRIVSSWLAANEAHELPLDPAPGRSALSELVAHATAKRLVPAAA